MEEQHRSIHAVFLTMTLYTSSSVEVSAELDAQSPLDGDTTLIIS